MNLWPKMTDEQWEKAKRIQRQADAAERERIENAIRAVYVRGDGVLYSCMAHDHGYTCGRCPTGFLGRGPKTDDRCPSCDHAVLVERGPAPPYIGPRF
jgi:rubrerythrin